MLVKELIEKLKDMNQDADVTVVVHNHPEEFSILWGGGEEGQPKEVAPEVSFYVDRLCDSEGSEG